MNVDTGNVDAALASAAHVVSGTYQYPYNGHLPIGPSCCVADVTAGRRADLLEHAERLLAPLERWRRCSASTLNQVRVTYYEGSSVYGNAPYEDCAESAALMSQLAGAPVRLQFMRWDEHGWDNYGPPQMTDVRGGVDANGNLVATEHDDLDRPVVHDQAARGDARLPAAVLDVGATSTRRTTGTQYNLRNRRVIGKSLPLQNKYLKTIWLRAPAAPQTTFAYEQMIDELAYAANIDPYQFRLQNIATQASDQANGVTALTWDRWKNVLTRGRPARELAAAASPRRAVGTGNVVTGRGHRARQLRRHAGGEHRRHPGEHEDREDHADAPLLRPGHRPHRVPGGHREPGGRQPRAGREPGALRAGRLRQATQVTSLDWVTYPIMRFKDSPKITFDFIQRTDIPAVSTGTLQANGTTAPSSTVAASGVFVGGSGEPPSTSDRRRDRERVLRRDGRSHPHGADDPGPRPRGAARGREALARGATRGGAGSRLRLSTTRRPSLPLVATGREDHVLVGL